MEGESHGSTDDVVSGARQDVAGLTHHRDRAISSDPLHRAARRSRGRRIRREQGRLVGQHHGRGDQLAVQGRVHPQSMMRPKGGWESVADFEIAVAEYVDGSTTDGSTARSAWSRPPS